MSGGSELYMTLALWHLTAFSVRTHTYTIFQIYIYIFPPSISTLQTCPYATPHSVLSQIHGLFLIVATLLYVCVS